MPVKLVLHHFDTAVVGLKGSKLMPDAKKFGHFSLTLGSTTLLSL